MKAAYTQDGWSGDEEHKAWDLERCQSVFHLYRFIRLGVCYHVGSLSKVSPANSQIDKIHCGALERNPGHGRDVIMVCWVLSSTSGPSSHVLLVDKRAGFCNQLIKPLPQASFATKSCDGGSTKVCRFGAWGVVSCLGITKIPLY